MVGFYVSTSGQVMKLLKKNKQKLKQKTILTTKKHLCILTRVYLYIAVESILLFRYRFKLSVKFRNNVFNLPTYTYTLMESINGAVPLFQKVRDYKCKKSTKKLNPQPQKCQQK
uniref:Uncharacterized protein n=1 Tax=Cacopsylla melanoneura TaxID=428564 RepID=A0A8D8ZA73_9HEMI